jgi:hypothetical protein
MLFTQRRRGVVKEKDYENNSMDSHTYHTSETSMSSRVNELLELSRANRDDCSDFLKRLKETSIQARSKMYS